jgi:hypothetical protein
MRLSLSRWQWIAVVIVTIFLVGQVVTYIGMNLGGSIPGSGQGEEIQAPSPR